jgi:hypothetical protein
MSVEVTLTLPEELVEQAAQLGRTTQRNVEDVLTDTLTFVEMLWPLVESLPTGALYPSVGNLPDAEVLALANLKMDKAQDRRLGMLQTKGKQGGLSEAERYELLALLQIYRLGQLRKSEALVEAIERGLRPPLTP